MSEISKFLSYVLRHKPDAINLPVDTGGWASIETLLERLSATDHPLTPDALRALVAESDKQRFTLSDDGTRIRAAQGHSYPVDLGLAPKIPPPILYHGSTEKNLESIFEHGLTRQSRQQVHLSASYDTAKAVGLRHGPLLLIVDAKRMHNDGHSFFQADNGVWLTDHVPHCYLSVITGLP